jgi:catechol 2,3-dioxygenase
MTELGHIVYYVRNLQASLRFYSEAVGLGVSGRIFNGRGALLSGGRTHHELLLIEVGDASGPLSGRRIGLYHAGWKVGEDLETLKRVKQRVEDLGFVIDGIADHTISQSLYLRDPDNNEVELYVDNPDCNWKEDESWMQAPVKPLYL